MAASLVLLLLVSLALTSTSALDKQIKLEDIERDNLQTELLRRPQPQSSAQHEQIAQLRQQQLHLQQQQQLHRQQQLAYQQQLLQQRYSAAQEPRYSAAQETRYTTVQEPRYATAQETRYASSQDQQQPLTYHQQFQQQIQQHREQALLREREREQRERERPEPQHHQALQHYAASPQLLQDVAAGTPHVMYLIMPGGNIAAIPISHPNQIQALFAPVKPHYSPYHSGPVGVPTQVVQAYYQPQAASVHSAAAASAAAASVQPEPERAERTQLHYVLPSQQHRITFTQASPQYSQAQQSVVYRESAPTDTEYQQYSPQSQKSVYSAGIKSTAAPQLKGATGFSTQTGSSYANFRQYSG